MSLTERRIAFACFGTTVTLAASAPAGRAAGVRGLLERTRERLLDVHDALTRFEASSELSRLNADPRATVPASPLLRALADAAVGAATLSGGLVDATILDELEAAGYTGHWTPEGLAGTPSVDAVRSHRTQATLGALRVDHGRGTITRPPGLRLDSGGLGKGLACDLVVPALSALPSFLVDCGGDLRTGGTGGLPRPVEITDPFGAPEPIHVLEVCGGAVATSGTTRRRLGEEGHHLIDPRTGRPAETDVVQATALAPTALEAEVRAKCAILAGPRDAARWLPHGGCFVTADEALHLPAARPAARRSLKAAA